MPLTPFHPAIAQWFSRTFAQPTPAQAEAWPAILEHRHTLIAAPTGSGKTLAAFLAAIDDLARQGIAGQLPDETQVVYVSPLKALSNDIERNLQWPLAGIAEQVQALGLPPVEIRVQVRSGDTAPAERAAMRKQPPHILVTTPESLYLLLTSDSGRAMLATTRTVIVDEIHALAGNKRGSHLALSLERLAALRGGRPLTRIGLSATQRPIEEVACFLVGAGAVDEQGRPDCAIIDSGHVRARDLALELPGAPLEAVMSNEVWDQVYDRLAELITAHRTTLVFTNTRRLAERVTRHLSERLGKDNVASHHGSLAKEQRLAAEQRLKQGALRALVATASLELGIDIGDVDLVCQLASPRSIATFLQRVGRANHAVSGVPKGRLFPLSRDELVECAALLDAVDRGELDRLIIPEKPLDVLAQQIVAEVASREWAEDELYALFRSAWPYRRLERREFDDVVHMLAEGYATRRGRRSAYLHRDAVNGHLRARRGTRLTALTCGGAIPDNADYRVILEPSGTFIGTLNEDFAVESMVGDVFQLGNTSYRILKIETGNVRVEDAQGMPPNIPFWLGEAPARTDELSAAVSRLRSEMDGWLTHVNAESISSVVSRLMEEKHLGRAAAGQMAEYLAAVKGVLGVIPSQDHIVFERFFDETGGMQFIIHSPFGSRINRAWGLALRKRFCRKFNFELQAAATDDAIVLSLGETHSFPLEEVAHYLNSRTVRDILIQAMLAAPLFTTRWRWNATIALAIKRFRNGHKHPPQLQRIDAEDLIAVVFPDQIACFENITGDREVPDHPLVNQTVKDCLHEAMDIDGLAALLAAVERGEIKIIARDLPHPSPLAQEILNAKPYAFLDDAPLEERRTQAVASRRWLDPATAADFGRLDAQAIQRVRDEAWPMVENADELHDALMTLGFLTDGEGRRAEWGDYLCALIAARRATCLMFENNAVLWAAVERLPMLQVVFANARISPMMTAPLEFSERVWVQEEAIVELVRSRLQGLGPVTVAALASSMNADTNAISRAMLVLEAEGFALRGQFTPGTSESEWCERRLLARIHQYTVQRLRAEIEPVTASDFLRFLFEWQGVTTEPRPEGPQALAAVIEQLEGYETAAVAWEADILAARLKGYDPQWLDGLCQSGRVMWARLTPPKPAADKDRGATPVRSTPIALLSRKMWNVWRGFMDHRCTEAAKLTPRAQSVADCLDRHGAAFFDDIVAHSGLLKSQAEEALAELVAWGFVSADSFAGLRTLLIPAEKRRNRRLAPRSRVAMHGIEEAGRWTLLRRFVQPAADAAPAPSNAEAVESAARLLLRRYGVVFRKLLEREASWLPPWYELLRVYRRLEARGEIRGGRFVAGFSGEQYALPEAVGSLRQIRRRPQEARLVSLSAADPLNLVGILTPGARVPALAGNRVLYRDGVPIAVYLGGEVQYLVQPAPEREWELRNALLRRYVARTEI